MFLKSNKKVFCIGFNKTGTTTIEQTLKDLGYKLGNQRKGENLLEDWAKRDFKRIIRLAKSAEAFQDVPFSLPFTYQVMDQNFRNAKFILTVRDNPEVWYQSLIKFHSKIWSIENNIPPTIEDLKSATYIYKGRPYKANRLIFMTPPDQPYEKESMIKYYLNHNLSIKNYFQHKANKLIVINVAKKGDYQKLCNFLEVQQSSDDFPWKNKT